MRIAHISNEYGKNNTGGAAIAATRLHLALLERGVESYFVALKKHEEGPNVRVLTPTRKFVRRLSSLIFSIIYNLYKGIVSGNLSWHRYQPPDHFVSVFDLKRELKRIKPDVVHIHWINRDGFSWRQIRKLSYPVVFHLHDMHLISTAFGYVGNDRRYVEGYNRGNSTLIERWIVWSKRTMLRRLRPLIIGPSHWICTECQQSVIGRGMTTAMIPNVLNPGGLLRLKKNRNGHEAFVLLFGCYSGTKNPYKGWEDLKAALAALDENIRRDIIVRIFGEDSPGRVEDGVRLEFLGCINTIDGLTEAYNSADVFVMPSRQDNAPSVKFEAWLCGLPVLAFDRQGCAEGIETGMSGWVSPDGDVLDYARGIEFFYGLFKSGELDKMHEQIAQKAADAYETDKIVAQFCEAYKSRMRQGK